MELWLWDVAHGSAAYLKTPEGRHVVVDLGIGDTSTRDAAFSPLLHLHRMGIQQLDQVILTHPHRDHLDDISNFNLLSPRVLLRPRHLTDDDVRAGNQGRDGPVIEKYLEINAQYAAPVPSGAYPLHDANSGMRIRTYQPTQCARTNLNNHSIVSFFGFAGSTICLPGDNEAASWRELLEDADFRRDLASVDILVAAHHGREAGYCEDIFDLCKPALVCVSDGEARGTSAVGKYFNRSRGWEVHSRSGGRSESRYVLTTRTDGSIRIRSGFGPVRPFMEVSIE